MPMAPKTLRRKVKRAPERRPNSHRRGYTHLWEKASKAWLEEQFSKGNVYCALCGEMLTGERSEIHVDHRVPPSSIGPVGSEDYESAFWSEANWQPTHPACNSRKGNRTRRYMITVVSGPPHSGKTTYVNHHKGENDLVYDMDAMGAAIGGFKAYPRPQDVVNLMVAWRDELVRMLNQNRIERCTWIIIEDVDAAKTVAERCGGRLVRLNMRHEVENDVQQ